MLKRDTLGRTILVVCLSSALLVSCAEEEPGPQFAGGPTQVTATQEIASLPSTPQPAATPVTVATPANLADLLNARGAVDRVFFALGDTVWSVAGTGAATRVYQAQGDERLLAIDAAPGADGVAILLGEGAAPGRRDLVIVDDAGEELLRIAEIAAVTATPSASAAMGSDLLDWSPQGDRLLISLADGAILSLTLDEETAPEILPIAVDGEAVVAPSWSPTGEAIAFIGANHDSRQRSLYLYNVGSGEVSDVVMPRDGRFVVDYVWMPDGVSLLFSEGGEPGGAVASIDLWRTDADGENRTLVASAGSVAPVARITQAAPSPDGRSVAYAVLVPGGGMPRVDSVWVRHLDTGTGFRISLPSVESIEDLWWTSNGLVMAVTTRPSAPRRQSMLALLRVQPDGSVSAIWAQPIGGAAPAGTPAATPLPG